MSYGIDFDAYLSQLKKKKQYLARRYPPPGRTRQPRDAGEEELLLLLDFKRWQSAIASGRVEINGPREYLLK